MSDGATLSPSGSDRRPNDKLKAARLRTQSPLRRGYALSREELGALVAAYVLTTADFPPGRPLRADLLLIQSPAPRRRRPAHQRPCLGRHTPHRGRYAGTARDDFEAAPRDATRNTTASSGSATAAAHARPPTSPVASPSSATMPCPANHVATASRAARSGLAVRARPMIATQSAAVAETAYRRTRKAVAAEPLTSSSEPSVLVGKTASATATPPVSAAAASKTGRDFTTPAWIFGGMLSIPSWGIVAGHTSVS